MIFVLARRSLLAHPARSAVLACGFGLGVAVMASLLGIGDVILAQAHAPALRGGGDVLVVGATGPVGSARYVLSSVLGTPPLAARVVAAAPTQRRQLFLVKGSRVVPIRARGGVPSLDRAMGDRETASIAGWTDTPADAAWVAPPPGAILRAMDRFHAIPDVPARAGSWAEWLYFNGRAGDTRFYLTFLVGPARAGGRRAAGVRFQLDDGGRMRSFSEGDEVDEARVLAEAPDLAIGGSRVRLEGQTYRVSLDLPGDGGGGSTRLTGALAIEGLPGRSMPPFTIRGAGGWISGYVVPVMSAPLSGRIVVDGREIVLDGGTGYHDHNWGFWDGVTWQWGHVQHEDLSFVYGRVHPPADAADPTRLPGFLGVLGRDGPVGYSTDVRIEETDETGSARPRRIVVRGHGASLALTLALDVEQAVTTRMPARAFGGGMDFYQVRARYRVSGQAGGRRIDFEAPGAAETFRGASPPPR